MSLKSDIEDYLKTTFSTQWTERDGRVVPESDSVALNNEAVKLDATILYADMAESTALVASHKWEFAAQIYKTFLYSACKVIRSNSGEIAAFDGDRVMAVFVGNTKNSDAVKAALQINYARQIINAEIPKHWKSSFEVTHCVGIDTSLIRAAKTGIRGSNDLVWVGRAANYAAKLCDERQGNFRTLITNDVHKKLMDDRKVTSTGEYMWETLNWLDYGITVHRSNYHWTF